MDPVYVDHSELPDDGELARIHEELTLLCKMAECLQDEPVPRKRRDLSRVRGDVR